MANKLDGKPDGKPADGDAAKSPVSDATKILEALTSTGTRADSLVAAIEGNAQIAESHVQAIE